MSLATFPYEHDGLALTGHLALPDAAGPHPAVLVMHSALGPDDLVQRRAAELAQAGYVALAADMYGAGPAGPIDHGSLFLALQHDPAALRARVAAALAALAALPQVDAQRIGAIGYCFGGQCVLELARSGADVRSVVSLHGLLTSSRPARAGEVRAKVLVVTGALDPYAPADDVAGFQREMKDAGVDWQVTVYGEGYHAFAHRNVPATIPGVRYDALLDRLSWAQTTAYLEGTLKG